jgi:hypothetical protein
MTSAMRAVMREPARQMAPKLLRIAMVRGGRVLEERLFKRPGDVTIGDHLNATFALASGTLFTLFERRGDGYVLAVGEGMKARVLTEQGVLTVGGSAGPPQRVPVGEDARGRVVVGEVTFLFQFVVPPPATARPQLPLAVKGDLASRIDWDLTILVAFSFLLHFGFVGAIYSDWMDPVDMQDRPVQGLIDLSKPMAPPPVEPAPETVTSSNDKPAPESKSVTIEESREVRVRPSSEQRAQALARAAEAMAMEKLGSLGGPTAVGHVLRKGDLPIADLTNAASASVGVTHDGSELKMPSSSGTITPGETSRGLQDIAVREGGKHGNGPGDERGVQGPAVDVRTGAPTTSGPIADAESVVASLRRRFRRCYEKGLAHDSAMSGSVVVAAKVSPNGEVSSVDAKNVQGLSSDVVSCIEVVVRGAQFTAPHGTGSTIEIPVKFVQQTR